MLTLKNWMQENLISPLQQEANRLKKTIIDNRKPLFLSFCLFAAFYGLYVALGIALIPDYEYNKVTFFFADQGDWVDLEWSKFHKGSHPLILLILAPFSFLKLFSPPIETIVLAIFLNSFFGASGIFLGCLVFWNLTQKYLDTALLTIVFGLSMSQLFFSSLLESYTLAALSIIATYILFIICLKQQKLYLGYWIIAGLFTFGVTITNFAETLICFFVTLFALKVKNKITLTLKYIGVILIIAFVLSKLQYRIFGGAYWFVPGMVSLEATWIKTTIFNHPILVSQELIKHFFLVNFVGANPFPEQIISGVKTILNYIHRPLSYSLFGLIGTLIWLFVLIAGLSQNVLDIKKDRSHLYFLIAIAFVILKNLALYSVFDTEEMFLFTSNFTFSVLLLAFNSSLLRKGYYKIMLVLLIIFMGINNLNIMRQIIEL